MKLLALAMFVALGMSTLAACDRPPETTAISRVAAQQSFNLADGNKDGLVSPNEATTVPNLDFAAADTDRSGALTPAEFEVALVKPVEPARPPGG